MKNLLPIGLVCLLVSCAKTNDKSLNPPPQGEKEVCTFGIESFNLAKREALSAEAGKKPVKPIKGGGNGGNGGGSTPTTPPPGSPVILLDFDGHKVSGTSWNYNGDFYCSPANLATDEMARIYERVSNDYSPFNIIVTLDENVYSQAPYNRRTRVVITESWEWFGQAGGVSFLNSFFDGSSAPCFVFSSLLNYNSRHIAEAASHEAGHTLALRHQSTYSNCVKTQEYNSGQGSGETGWAPIMGIGYGQNLTLWHKGPNSISCTNIQDDVQIIAGIVGFRADDHADKRDAATPLNSALSGAVNSSSDIDYFSLNLTAPKSISLIPVNTGAGNAGANADLVLRVYNGNGSLMYAVNDPAVLHASTTLSAGSYYLSVAAAGNTNTGTYGMLGKYIISSN